MRRFFSSTPSAAHRLVQQRVQTQLSLLPQAAPKPATRVVFVSRAAASSPSSLQASLPFPVSAAALEDFKAKPQEKLYLYPSSDDAALKNQRVLLVGLGDAGKVTPNVLRDATHGALSAIKAKRARDVVLQVPNLDGCKLDAARVVELLSQASMLSNYQFDQYLTDSKDVYGDNKLRLPLEQIYLDASVEFQKVRINGKAGQCG
jgi:leucyl aminopeptidase